MRVRRIAIVTATAAIVAGGAGAAVGATAGDQAKEAESNILGDAAKRLDTSPEELRAALKAAQDAELARRVKAGELTQEQADRIKQRRDASGLVLGRPGGRGHHGGPGRGGRGGRLMGASLAEALGLTRAQLRSQLQDGKTVAQIAKAQGKSLADVRKAVRADAQEQLAAAVKAGDLTQAQADERLEHLDEHLARIGELGGERGRFGGPGRGHHDGPFDRDDEQP